MTNRIVLAFHFLVFVALATVAILTPGTGNGGDSLTHFFMAEISWDEPRFLFKHWGKPFFTLFASPWAQFGFVGIKIFNVLCGVLASFVTYLLAKKMNKGNEWSIVLIAFLSPTFYVYLMSGLTEPFSALVAVTSVWLVATKRISLGFLLASFLPFCRSEAQLFLALFLVYAIVDRKYKYIPILLSGSLIYSVVGWALYFDNFFWVWDIPYKSGASTYGKGEWWHYLFRLHVMLALPGMVLLLFGTVDFVKRVFVRKIDWKIEPFLVQFIFFGLLISHSLVWALGVYASAGLERVLVLIFPFAWLMMLDGINLISKGLKKWVKYSFIVFISLYSIGQIYVLKTDGRAKFYRSTLYKLSPEDRVLKEQVVPFIEENYADTEYFVFEKGYLAVLLGINPMDKDVSSQWFMARSKEMELPDKALFIWDSRHPKAQYGIDYETAKNHPQLKEIKRFYSENDWDFVVFEFIPSSHN